MMGAVVATVSRVTAVQLNGRGGAVRGGRCLVVMLVISVLQLMGLRVIKMVATTGCGREEIGPRGRYVITLAVLLAGWELWVHHDRSGRQMVAGRCLLVLVVVISTASGWIHQERAHFFIVRYFLPLSLSIPPLSFFFPSFFLPNALFFLFSLSLSLSLSRIGRGEKRSGIPLPRVELVSIHRRGEHGGSMLIFIESRSGNGTL